MRPCMRIGSFAASSAVMRCTPALRRTVCAGDCAEACPQARSCRVRRAAATRDMRQLRRAWQRREENKKGGVTQPRPSLEPTTGSRYDFFSSVFAAALAFALVLFFLAVFLAVVFAGAFSAAGASALGASDPGAGAG